MVVSSGSPDGFVVAVDAGGSNARSVLVRTDGACLAVARTGGANPLVVGMDNARTRMVQCVTDVARTAGPVSSVVIAGAGGSYRPELADGIRADLFEAGIAAPLSVFADGLAAFCSGTHERDGYVLVSGTGAVALRVRNREVVGASDGLGWLLGDSGSGFWVGRETIRAVLEDLDGRGPATALTPLLLESLGIPPVDDRVDGEGRPLPVRAIAEQAYADPPIALARHAILAFRAADDPVAARILSGAASHLADTLAAAITPEVSGPVIVVGGLLAGQQFLREAVTANLLERGIDVQLQPAADGLAGAATLGLRSVGVDVDEQVFHSIAASLLRLRR